MGWLIGVVIVGFLYYHFILVKHGNIKFWKIVSDHPEEAYVFCRASDCFAIFDSKPLGGYRMNLPAGKWDGPFRMSIPSKSEVVIMYGRSSDYEAAQEEFINRYP